MKAYIGASQDSASVWVTREAENMQVIILNQDNVETTMRFYSILHAKLDKNITGILKN